jgi:hypothetical protein
LSVLRPLACRKVPLSCLPQRYPIPFRSATTKSAQSVPLQRRRANVSFQLPLWLVELSRRQDLLSIFLRLGPYREIGKSPIWQGQKPLRRFLATLLPGPGTRLYDAGRLRGQPSLPRLKLTASAVFRELRPVDHHNIRSRHVVKTYLSCGLHARHGKCWRERRQVRDGPQDVGDELCHLEHGLARGCFRAFHRGTAALRQHPSSASLKSCVSRSLG